MKPNIELIKPSRLHLLSCCTGMVVFDALWSAKALGQTPQPLGINDLVEQDSAFLESTIATASAKLKPENYVEVIQMACNWGGYGFLVLPAALPGHGSSALPGATKVLYESYLPKQTAPQNVTVGDVDAWITRTFDLRYLDFGATDHVWLARHKDELEEQQLWEWGIGGIHTNLAGIALPDAMVQHFLSEAVERYEDVHGSLHAESQVQTG